MSICPVCEKSFDTYYTTYCSRSCGNKARTAKNEVKYLKNPKLCKQCEGPIPYRGRHDSVFCSRACSAKFNNARRAKKEYTCSNCGVVKKQTRRTTLCRNCRFVVIVHEFGKQAVSDFKSTFARHKYQLVRHHAHRVASILRMSKRCFVCGYDKHVELAHKKAIYLFDVTVTLNEINAKENLVYLCPNHHWELDNGILNLSEALVYWQDETLPTSRNEFDSRAPLQFSEHR